MPSPVKSPNKWAGTLPHCGCNLRSPIRYTPNEVNGFADRARYMCSIAEEALADKKVVDPSKPQFTRFIKRMPLGVILVIPAWNYPLLTAVNAIVPALLSGLNTTA